MASRFILKQLDYSLPISMCDTWLGLRARRLLKQLDYSLSISIAW